MGELEEEKDLELQLLFEEHTFVEYYQRELEKFFLEHREYFEDKLAQEKNEGLIFTAIQLKDPALLTEEEKTMLPKMERLMQMHADGEDMEFKHEELLSLEDSKPIEFPYWIQRHPVLLARANELYETMNENVFEFSESVFFPQTPEDYNPNRIEDELRKVENREVEAVVKDSDREFYEKARLGELQDLDHVHKEETYVKKTQMLGEVLNRISNQVQSEFEQKMENFQVPSPGAPPGRVTRRGSHAEEDSGERGQQAALGRGPSA